jgi:copper oxidase (laccase) domain-containing protein
LCTFCRDDMFASYRRGERSVRQINFVSLKG